MIVSEFQAQLHAEGERLLGRLGLKDTRDDPSKGLPSDYGFLHLVPALHAIVDRLEPAERLVGIHEGVIATMMGRLDKLEARLDRHPTAED